MGLFSRKVVYRESDTLRQIDGFLVTDGVLVRITIRKQLDPKDKLRGRQALLNRFEAERQPGVYLWSHSDDQTYYKDGDVEGLEGTDTAKR